jgi:hypothetical protein
MKTTIVVVSKYVTVNGHEYRVDQASYPVENWVLNGYKVYSVGNPSVLVGFVYPTPRGSNWYAGCAPIPPKRWYHGETMEGAILALGYPETNKRDPVVKFTRFELIGVDD